MSNNIKSTQNPNGRPDLSLAVRTGVLLPEKISRWIDDKCDGGLIWKLLKTHRQKKR